MSRWRWRSAVAVLFVAVLLTPAGCGAGGADPHPAAGGGGPLTIVETVESPFVVNFNPFSTSNVPSRDGAESMVYEPLIQYDLLDSGTIYPWLATSWAWSHGGESLTFTIRRGVKWTDGQPFTAADVAYTFNLLRRFPALNSQGVTVATATAPSATTAVLTFAKPSYGELFSISQVLMVPEHLWSRIADPVTDTDTKPVGTGPYLLSSFTPQAMTFTRNPGYWQPGLPKVPALRYPSYASNSSADLALEHGEIDWASLFLPDYRQLFLDKSSTNHVNVPPVGSFGLCPNLTDQPLNEVAVRQALSMALDRSTITAEGEAGFADLPATNSTGLILPNWAAYLSTRYANAGLPYNPAGAKTLLERNGFKPGSGGMLDEPNGQPFELSVMVPAPFSDMVTDAQLMVGEFKAAGIRLTIDAVSYNAFYSDLADGDFQLAPCGQFQSQSPYALYDYMLDDTLTAPVGQPAVGDVERWRDPATQAALEQYATTNRPAVQVAAVQKLEEIVAREVPYIPLMYATGGAEYSTARFTGWPAAGDEYEVPSPSSPWGEVVVLRLRPAPGRAS